MFRHPAASKGNSERWDFQQAKGDLELLKSLPGPWHDATSREDTNVAYQRGGAVGTLFKLESRSFFLFLFHCFLVLEIGSCFERRNSACSSWTKWHKKKACTHSTLLSAQSWEIMYSLTDIARCVLLPFLHSDGLRGLPSSSVTLTI